VLLLLTFVVTGVSQAADIKIGFVNVTKILKTGPEAGKVSMALEKEFSARKRRLLASSKEYRKLEEKAVKDGALMSEAEGVKLKRKLVEKSRELKRNQEEFREDLTIRNNEELAKLQRLVFEAITSLSESEKFDLVLVDGVIFASESVDITDKVQARLSTLKK